MLRWAHTEPRVSNLFVWFVWFVVEKRQPQISTNYFCIIQTVSFRKDNILPHTSTDAYALIYKCFTHFRWCFGWCFCGRILGGDCGKVCRISVFLHNQANRKVFYIFSAECWGFLYTFCAEYWGGDYTFFAEWVGVWGCEFWWRGWGKWVGWVGEMVFFGALWWWKLGVSDGKSLTLHQNSNYN